MVYQNNSTRNWWQFNLREFWQYREVLRLLVIRQIQLRYRQTLFGMVWVFLDPIINIGVFTLIFGRFAKLPSEGIPYPLFLLPSILIWNLFLQTSTQISSCLSTHLYLASKVYFPRLFLPIQAIATALFDFLTSLLVFVPIFFIYRDYISPTLGLLVWWVIYAILISISISLWLATVAVRFRDIGSLLRYVLRIMQFGLPVIYSQEIMPTQYIHLLQWNPLYWLVMGTRSAILGNTLNLTYPFWLTLLALLVSGVLAVFWFEQHAHTVIDWL
ncbi:MAG TPA: ABC transporter permease [Anaerolineales bacterium]|nr:ABC transporter permease [Anaerolineales bacterium]